MNDRPHWITRLLFLADNGRGMDGFLLGLVLALGVPVILWLWWTGQ